MQQAAIGLIGGRGLGQMAGLEEVQSHLVDAPHGRPLGVRALGLPRSEVHSALTAALITPRETWSAEAQARLAVQQA